MLPDRTSVANERGFVLVSVLWAVALASLLVSALNSSARTSAMISSAETAVAQLEFAADAAVELAVARISTSGPQRWIADGRTYTLSLDRISLAITVQHAAGLIDLNTTDPEKMGSLLSGLLANPTQARELQTYILEQRANARAAAQSSLTFFEQNRDGDANDKPVLVFRDVSDLLNSPNLNRRTYRQLYPFLTVFSGNKNIDLAYAPSALLKVFPETATDRNQKSAELRRRETEPTILANNSGQLETDNNVIGEAFHISIRATTKSMRQSLTTSVVIMTDSGSKPYRSLSWQPFRNE